MLFKISYFNDSNAFLQAEKEKNKYFSSVKPYKLIPKILCVSLLCLNSFSSYNLIEKIGVNILRKLCTKCPRQDVKRYPWVQINNQKVTYAACPRMNI